MSRKETAQFKKWAMDLNRKSLEKERLKGIE